jgi:mannitol/fructose-specific phosphotransferase system IIA component (Ntr-type)
MIVKEYPQLNSETVLAALIRREEQGSTFLNESVAIPHARVEGLQQPELALALALAVTCHGISDVSSELPIEAVFLLLAPMRGTAADLQMLTKAIRLFQNLNVRRRLLQVNCAQDVLSIMADNEFSV